MRSAFSPGEVPSSWQYDAGQAFGPAVSRVHCRLRFVPVVSATSSACKELHWYAEPKEKVCRLLDDSSRYRMLELVAYESSRWPRKTRSVFNPTLRTCTLSPFDR